MTNGEIAFGIIGIIYAVCLIPTTMVAPTVYRDNNPQQWPFPIVFINCWLIMPIFLIYRLFK